ncbi:MAG: hypothetical protein LC104_03115 [Bacteroidales bacterium]|nr:hypothetical protein [Bacteroidales bacterium]
MLRSWLIRCMILTVLAAVGFVAISIHHRIRPEQVRASLISVLETEFTQVDVHVQSARLRLFGGISVTDLRLTRRGESVPFFEAPTATIYHDKRQLHRGQLVIRKIELDNLTIRVNRREDGTWDFQGLAQSTTTDAPIPTVVIRRGTVIVTDALSVLPALEVRDIRLELLNDPISRLKFDIQARVVSAEEHLPYAFPIGATGYMVRAAREAHVQLTLPEIRCDTRLAAWVGRYHPMMGEQLAAFTATAAVRVDATLGPQGLQDYDLQCDLRDGQYTHAMLPWKIEQLAARLHFHAGQLRIENGSARLGGAHVQLQLQTRSLFELPATVAESPIDTAQTLLERVDVDIHHLTLDPTIQSLLPASGLEFWERFQPAGTVHLRVGFQHTSAGWRREAVMEPANLEVIYSQFRYPVTGITGRVTAIQEQNGREDMVLNLTGIAGGQKIAIRGNVSGDGPDPAIDLTITGKNVPIDDQLFSALKPKYAAGLLKLNAVGRGDFTVTVRQEHNVNLCQNLFHIQITDGVLRYTAFPYPLSDIRADVQINVDTCDPTRPRKPGQPLTPEEDHDHITLRGFTARHGPGRVLIEGENSPASRLGERKTAIRIRGQNCPLNTDFRTAIAKLGGAEIWNELNPNGLLDVAVDLDIAEDAAAVSENVPSAEAVQTIAERPLAMDQVRLRASFRGPSIRPASFPYELRELTGVARYQDGQLELGRLSGKHGRSLFRLAAVEVRTSDTAVWTNLGGLSVSPLILDPELLQALPQKLRAGLDTLQLQGPMDLHIEHAVIDLPKIPSPASRPVQTHLENVASVVPPRDSEFRDPIVFWRGELRLAGAGMHTGVTWSDLHGTLACTGRYEGTHIGSIFGDAWLDRAIIANQPVHDAKLTMRVPTQQPDPQNPGQFTAPVVEFPDLHGKLFHGTIGGEARVVLDDQTGYRLWLTAANVRLDEIATHYGLGSEAELRGIAQGQLLLESRLDPRTGEPTMAGSGEIDIPTGRMYNLPITLPLLKLLKLQAPDQTAFEEAHAQFELLGDRVTVKHLDLLGTAISLGGSGELTTDGQNLRFECYTIWSQALHRLLNAPTRGELTGALNSNLFRIDMVKRDGGPIDYKPRVLPAVTDPVRAMVNRVRERTATRWADSQATIRAVGPR